MSTCQMKLRAWAKDDGIFQCRRPYGHEKTDPQHEATGLYEYQTIAWLDGDRRQFVGEWVPCEAICTLPVNHSGNHAP